MFLPEELLERIVDRALSVPTPRLPWLPSSRTRLAPLSVSRQFNRIATPLLYRSIHLAAPGSAVLLLDSLHARPEYARHIRELVVQGVWHPVIDILRLSQNLLSLDLTIAFDDGPAVDLDTVFISLADMRHLTLRKPNNVYLSLARPRSLLVSVAHAIPSWPNLRTANIAFKLSDDTPVSPTASFAPVSFIPAQPASGPIASLAAALAASPALHTFSTALPSVWNTSIPTIASNPALERICLSSPAASSSATATAPVPLAIPGTGLFLMEARRHPRLADLINAGTPIIRSRAHTLGTRVPPSSSSSSSSPPSVPSSSSPTKPTVGLGLRIDTSDEAIAGLGLTYASPVASSAGAGGVINPAWMGPVRGVSMKGRGKRRTRV